MNVEKIITLKPEEAVLRVARNFWLVYVPHLFVGAFFILLAFFVMSFLISEYGGAGFAVFLVLNVIGAWHVARTLVKWHWNAFVVTNFRVVDVDQRGFFERVVSEAPIDKIQDLSYSVKGVLGTVFNFGSVSLQTSGSNALIDLSNTKNPKELYHLIVETRAKHQGAGPMSRTDKVSALLEAAGQLDQAEARALLTSLQQAVNVNRGDAAKQEPEHQRENLDKDLGWFKDEEEK